MAEDTKPTATAQKTSAFKVPGEGSSLRISVVTIVTLLVAWAVVTNAGWIKPLFLPSPQAVGQQFWEYLTGAANDKPLWHRPKSSSTPGCKASCTGCTNATTSAIWST